MTVAYADTLPESQSTGGKTAGRPFAFQSPPTFVQSVLLPDVGKRWKTLVHVRRFAIEDLPSEEDGLRSWLEERWVEKGRLLEELREKLVRGESWDDETGKEKGE